MERILELEQTLAELGLEWILGVSGLKMTLNRALGREPSLDSAQGLEQSGPWRIWALVCVDLEQPHLFEMELDDKWNSLLPQGRTTQSKDI